MFRSVRRSRRRRFATAVRVLALGLLALGGLAVASVLFLWRYAATQIDEVEIPTLRQNRAADAPQDAVPGTLNVLVVGTDSREGLTAEQLLDLGTEDLGTRLTDTIMLVQVSPNRDEAVIVSFPRDLRVDPPGDAGVMKINAVHATGGPDLIVRTIQDYTGVLIDHYAEINLRGFLDLTDALGGVDVCLSEPMRDAYAGVDLPSGCQTLTGPDAAGFVRSRRVADEFGTADDFGRIARQQYFVRQAMAKVTAAGTLLNPLKIKRVIDAVGSNLTTDRDLGLSEMLSLASALKGLGPDDLATRAVPGYWNPETGFVHPYPEQAEALFQSLRDGERIPDVGTAAAEELAPRDVRVLILNGVGTAGLAGEVATFLEDRDFVVVDSTNAETFDPALVEMVITHRAGAEDKAKLLAGYLAGSEVRLVVDDDAVPTGADVVLTVGSSWSSE